MVLELFSELLELAFYGVSSLGLLIAGIYIERFALETVQSSQPLLAIWAAVIGIGVLYFGYLMTTDKLSTKLTGVQREIEKITS